MMMSQYRQLTVELVSLLCLGYETGLEITPSPIHPAITAEINSTTTTMTFILFIQWSERLKGEILFKGTLSQDFHPKHIILLDIKWYSLLTKWYKIKDNSN